MNKPLTVCDVMARKEKLHKILNEVTGGRCSEVIQWTSLSNGEWWDVELVVNYKDSKSGESLVMGTPRSYLIKEGVPGYETSNFAEYWRATLKVDKNYCPVGSRLILPAGSDIAIFKRHKYAGYDNTTEMCCGAGRSGEEVKIVICDVEDEPREPCQVSPYDSINNGYVIVRILESTYLMNKGGRDEMNVASPEYYLKVKAEHLKMRKE